MGRAPDAEPQEAAPARPLEASLEGLDPEVQRIVEEARAGLRDAPEDPLAWARLGMAYEANYLPELAAPAYREAARLDPAQAKWSYRLGVTSEDQGLFEQALEHYDRALGLEPRFPPLHWRRGLLLLELGRLEEARSAFRRAVRLHPSDPGGWTGLARAHLQLDQPEQAIENLRQVLKLLPDDPYALSLLAGALRRAGQPVPPSVASGASRATGALPTWIDPFALELNQYRANTALWRETRAVELVESRRPEEAAKALAKLVAESPQDASLLHKLGLAQAAAGRPQEARDTLQRVLALEPEDRNAKLDLALLLRATGEPQEAERLAREVVAAHPGFARGPRALAEILEQRGEREAALDAYLAALALDQREAEPFARAAWLELELQRPDAAAEHARRALALDPANHRALLVAAVLAAEQPATDGRQAVEALLARVPEEARGGALWQRALRRIEAAGAR